ncbi:CYTH domain-containing protein [Nonomuraea sp. NN258]|uniref:CYTH domain-containing protein n=1 Tax=Nonomuraea antri TaxID=2730852 RepID=UPI001567F21E|nr:CYTH domain-containing protein [Nonomuraea antri]NRQ37364.1 CYTH domain-containing protein [Nonomuraea antri]
MAAKIEIERKFLLASPAWRAEVVGGEPITQFYVSLKSGAVARLRRYGPRAFVAVKSSRTGLARMEAESEISPALVDDVLASGVLLAPPIVKVRHLIPADGGLTFEVDEYAGDNAGLVVAEIELPDADADPPRPDWLGREVTGDRRYGNLALARHPYSRW